MASSEPNSPKSVMSSKSNRESHSMFPIRSNSSSSNSSVSSTPVSPIDGERTGRSMFMPSFTSTAQFYSRADSRQDSRAEISSIEISKPSRPGSTFSATTGDSSLPASLVMAQIPEDSQLDYDIGRDREDMVDIPDIGDIQSGDGDLDVSELIPRMSIESSTDSVSSVSSNTISITPGKTNPSPLSEYAPSTGPTPVSTQSNSSTSTTSSFRRIVPPISSAKFTSFASNHPSTRAVSAGSSQNTTRSTGLLMNRRNSLGASTSKDSTKLPMVLDDSVVTTTSTAKKRANKLRKKASVTSIANLAQKKSNSSQKEQSGRSRFFFLQKHHSTPQQSAPQILTGGPKQQSTRQYKVLPPTEGIGMSLTRTRSSGSSSGSSTTSQNSSATTSYGQNSSAKASLQTLFIPTTKISGSLSEKSPNSPLESSRSNSFDHRRNLYSPPSPPSFYSVMSNDSVKHKHHLLLRPRKDSHPGMILSSSSSNSKLTSDAGTMYSFNPSSPHFAPYAPYGLQKSISNLDVKSMSYKDITKIGEQALEDVWPFLCARVTPIFTGDGLKVPVEDLNKLVLLHVKRRISEHDPTTLINDVKDLLNTGISGFESSLGTWSRNASETQMMGFVSDVWQYFYTTVLPYIQAVFLPLQMEFQGVGSLLTSDEAKRFWERSRSSSSYFKNVRLLALMIFRDNVILPLSQRITVLLVDVLDLPARELVGKLQQCISILSYVRSKDDNQRKINELRQIVTESIKKLDDKLNDSKQLSAV
ncbi:HbrB-like-domain-containing protein [Dipodascopsis uninucleata]